MGACDDMPRGRAFQPPRAAKGRYMHEGEADGLTIGDRLRQAREARDMSLEDVAARTRIPLRHLKHIEAGEWDALPAITYAVGFARSYANAIGLDGAAVGVEVREKLGSAPRPAPAPAEYYEPADPARVPPRGLAIGALLLGIAAVILFLTWPRGGEVPAPPPSDSVAEVPLPDPTPVETPAAPSGPVVLTATDDVWLRVYEAQGGTTLFQNTLPAGQSFEVPATAAAPLIRTGRPNALRVTVGQAEIPPLGPPERTVSDVSLAAPDLLARLQQPPAD